MQFLNKSSQENSLYHYTLYELGKRVSTSNSIMDTTSLPVTDFCRSAISYYRKAAYLIWRNTSGWEFDDSNYTNLPIATTDLVDSQQDYALPTGGLDVQRMEVLGSDGKWNLLTRIDKAEVTEDALTRWYSTSGLPRHYDIVANSLFLYPSPSSNNVTLTAGLKIYLTRDVSAPTNPGAYRNISQEPGFHPDFHPYISWGSALDYGIRNNYPVEKINNIRTQIDKYEKDIVDYYSERDRDYSPKFRPKTRSSV